MRVAQSIDKLHIINITDGEKPYIILEERTMPYYITKTKVRFPLVQADVNEMLYGKRAYHATIPHDSLKDYLFTRQLNELIFEKDNSITVTFVDNPNISLSIKSSNRMRSTHEGFTVYTPDNKENLTFNDEHRTITVKGANPMGTGEEPSKTITLPYKDTTLITPELEEVNGSDIVEYFTNQESSLIEITLMNEKHVVFMREDEKLFSMRNGTLEYKWHNPLNMPPDTDSMYPSIDKLTPNNLIMDYDKYSDPFDSYALDEQNAQALSQTNTPIFDEVTKPSHYNQGSIEVIDIIEQIAKDYPSIVAPSIGNVIKYVARSPHKGTPLKDLQKAKWYLERAITTLEKEGTSNDTID